MRKTKSFLLKDPQIKERLLRWAAGRRVCCVLDSNQDKLLFKDRYSLHEYMAAVDPVSELRIDKCEGQNGFEQLKSYFELKKDWLFGYFTYDLKNEIENLLSGNIDYLGFPEMHFFQPKFVLGIKNGQLNIEYLPEFNNEPSVENIYWEIINTEINEFEKEYSIDIKPGMPKGAYINELNKIKKHILRGDIYEMNYCMEFYDHEVEINAQDVHRKLNVASPMPFSCYYKNVEEHLICASPERFLAKRGNKIISQPMKGTAGRGESQEEDALIRRQLQNDLKERSENVMIVDLVRNDLSKTASPDSVKVEELYGVYSFKQLHQMISTVVSEMRTDIHWTDVIKNAFPMGSMTGAPKVRAMQLIEQYEKTKRGLYSGSVGYITPDADFDFNVVIRSILYNQKNNFLSFMVGSAITANSDPEKEYDECLLKAQAMMQVLNESCRELTEDDYQLKSERDLL